ncbi:MAG: flagellar biosynthesis anti-sigma factor FlgM [Succinivibrionaceae bacterium]|nr:flagellar biosynthesis anti-sigma factor FlgM [Succinivibrionaceae bacterium]
MSVTALSDHAIKSLADPVGSNKVKNQSPTAAGRGAQRDSVTLSSTSVAQRGIEVARAASGIDEAKVAGIKESIRNGSYKVNYESVASHLIDSEAGLSSIFG